VGYRQSLGEGALRGWKGLFRAQAATDGSEPVVDWSLKGFMARSPGEEGWNRSS